MALGSGVAVRRQSSFLSPPFSVCSGQSIAVCFQEFKGSPVVTQLDLQFAAQLGQYCACMANEHWPEEQM